MKLRSGKRITTESGAFGLSDNDGVLESNLNGCKHPLVIPEILAYIFGYLQLQHLKNCRLVSQIWNNTAIRSVGRKSDKISFINKTHVSLFITQFSRSHASTIVNKFKLFFTEIMKHDVVYIRFMKLVSPWTTELSLSFYEDSSNFVNSIKQKPLIVTQYQSLEKMHVEMFTGPKHEINSTHSRGRKIFLDCVHSVLANAPKLRSLSVACSGHLRDGFVTELLCDGDIAERLKNISCLHLTGGIANSDLENLANSEMKLTELSADFDLNMFPVSNNSLCRLLESQASTLQTLEIKGVIKPCSKTVNFPTFTNLRVFTFEGSIFPGLVANYPSWFPEINFRAQFPSLKKLDIAYFGSDEWLDSLERHSHTIENLEELRFHGIKYPKETFEHLARIFTKLRKLEIPSNPDLTKIAFMSFTNLEELVLDVIDDTIETTLTGLPFQKCKELNKLSNPELKNLEINELTLERINPPVSKLKELKIIRLIPTTEYLPIGISKVTTELVLKKMPNLKILDFGRRTAEVLTESEFTLSNLKESFIVLDNPKM